MNNPNKVIKYKEGSVVTLQMAKQQLNVDEDFRDDDSHILMLVESATGMAEDYTGIDIALTSNALVINDFVGDSIRIYEAPYNGLPSITYMVGDVEHTIDLADVSIQILITEFIVNLPEHIRADSITVKFATGFDMDAVPYQIVSAILIKINDLYDNFRTSVTVGVNYRENNTFERLLNGHVISRLLL